MPKAQLKIEKSSNMALYLQTQWRKSCALFNLPYFGYPIRHYLILIFSPGMAEWFFFKWSSKIFSLLLNKIIKNFPFIKYPNCILSRHHIWSLLSMVPGSSEQLWAFLVFHWLLGIVLEWHHSLRISRAGSCASELQLKVNCRLKVNCWKKCGLVCQLFSDRHELNF